MAASGYERVHMSRQAKFLGRPSFFFLGGLGPKGVDRVGDQDADAYDEQACNRGFKQHRGDFHRATREQAALRPANYGGNGPSRWHTDEGLVTNSQPRRHR